MTETRNDGVEDARSQGCDGLVRISGVVIELVFVLVHTVEGEAIHCVLELISIPQKGIVVNMKSFLKL